MRFRVRDLVGWARERENIRLKKEAGTPKPWTKDPILLMYKFCCIRREDDRVTRWIREEWRSPNAGDPHLWHAMAVARFLNWPEALEEAGYPEPWGRRRGPFLRALRIRKERGEQNFSGAYMVRSDPCCKIDYVASVFEELWEKRKTISETLHEGGGLAGFHAALVPVRGMGSFMAAQVVADMRHVAPLNGASDLFEWAASGPGSRRGLSRVCGFPVDFKWRTEGAWFEVFHELHLQVIPVAEKVGLEPPHGQDLQGWLCEFDKYERVRLGEGRPRSLYPGKGE